MVGREVPFAVGIFYLAEKSKELFHGRRASKDNSWSLKSCIRWSLEEAAASVTCAAAVNIFSHPPSVVLARQQGLRIPLGQALREVYAQGALRGFYLGFVARTLSIAGSMWVVPLVLSLGSPWSSKAH